MANRSKGPRLYLRPARGDRGAVWVIRDGHDEKSTGFGPEARDRAEKSLADYIVSKHDPRQWRNGDDPGALLIADALSVYLLDVAPKQSRPHETAARVINLVKFFNDRTLGELSGDLCRAYAEQRTTPAAARRELEDLRAAIRYAFRDNIFAPRINIQMPDKPPPRERWLTREEAARLLWAAWRRKQPIPNSPGKYRYIARHVARFILVGLYTGTRSAAICGAAIRPTVGRGYVDLERGVFYRRAPGSVETKKRQPPVRLPRRLLAHLRRWERLGLCVHSVVEWEGEQVGSISKSFRRVAHSAGLHDVSPHILRHTSITWAMQEGVKTYDAAGYFGVTEEVIRSTYGHHHPDHQKSVTDALDRRRS